MTEDKAKTKWCPHVCSVPAVADGKGGWDIPTGIPAHNRLAGTALVGRCIASACMAWRWLPSFDTSAKIEAIRKHRDQHNSTLVDAKNAVEATWVEIKSGGYCGLAGSPS